MDVQERLTVEQATGPGLVASEHVHRYELAAELCAGLRVADIGCGVGYGSAMLRELSPAVTGVDYDAATVETARRTFGRDGLEFEQADGVEFLRGPLHEHFDAIVMFESLEHLADVEEALSSLRRHAESGVRLIISVPNSRAFEEENPYHRADFGFEETMEAFADFPEVRMLHQFLAEGSLIRTVELGQVTRRTVLEGRSEPEYANHFIACVNFGDALGLAGDRARMELTVAPNVNRYMTDLERANHELRHTNARLAREKLGHADSAAASLLGQLQTARRRLAELEQDEARLQREAERAREAWIEELQERVRDSEVRLAEVEASRAWRLASRYWRASARVKSWLRRG